MNPTVTVIVTSHLDSCKPYLDACLWALGQSEGVTFETIVISSARTPEKLHFPSTNIHAVSLDSVSKKWRSGVALANPASEFFLFLSDDVMLSRHALADMVAAARVTGGIVSPFAQAEHRGRFVMAPPVLAKPIAWSDSPDSPDTPTLTLTPDMTLEQVEGWHQEIVDRPRGPDIIAVQPWVAFYAPMMSRKVYEAVGELDPALDCRHNDEQYCYRAAKLGIPSVFCLRAPVLHFGSRTLSEAYTPADMDAATVAFQQKIQN